MTRASLFSRARWSGNGGFTMVEVLVAFTVLATLTLAVQRGLAASVAATAKSELRLNAERIAQTLITTPLGPDASALVPLSGSIDGYAWQIRFEPIELPVAATNVNDGKPPRWVPVRMMIDVLTKSGARVEIETIRLVKV